jgi:hypothetical protein
MEPLRTAEEVIRYTGGTKAFADWYGVSMSLASAWRKRGFPSKRHIIISSRLKAEKGVDVSPNAFGMLPVPQPVPCAE